MARFKLTASEILGVQKDVQHVFSKQNLETTNTLKTQAVVFENSYYRAQTVAGYVSGINAIFFMSPGTNVTKVKKLLADLGRDASGKK